MTEEIQLTPEEKLELSQYLYGTPVPDEKHSVHTFLNKVATSEDTTKLGFLKEEEVGTPRHPIRAYKNFALISDKIIDNPFFNEYFKAESEIVTSTSLSRDAKLLNLAVIQRRQVEDITKPKKVNKGWFQKKEQNEEQQT